ncbi:hypothetical protein SDC9_57590 [bioreactor metagenome]|uniref:VTT domain-containing protein n=1 Tax=bioreactor metagenome TaxID=1076179 RepID=A0A644X512_9ZZZZ
MRKGGFIRRWRLQYLYFKRTGFYTEVGRGLFNFILILAVVLLLLFLASKTFLDIEGVFNYFVHHVPRWLVILVFFASESLLSPIPSDLFIIWSEEMPNPWLCLSGLAALSYAAGVVSFLWGRLIRKNKKVNAYFAQRFEKYIRNSRKWGGWLIIAAAMTPLPFSMIMVVVGMLNYPWKRMLIWSLFRFPRFLLYGLLIYHVVNI